jgi:LacI family xylobiose transport system transcriptional regulator
VVKRNKQSDRNEMIGYRRTMTLEPPTERVRLADVAAVAGVSLSTISKVLNGRSDVSAPTRARIEAALDDAGYRRRSVLQRSDLIELVFHELESAWSMEIIRGVENIARTRGMSVVLTESGSRHAPGPEWISGVIGRKPAGVVLVFSDLAPEHKEQLRLREIPFVIIDPAGDPSPGVPSVGSANWSGGLAATRHLLELGHTRIAAITGPEDMMCSLARLDGFRSAMNSAGVPIDPELIRFGDFHVDGGRRIAEELLRLPERPTAIFAGSDLQALGVLEAARTLGLSIPGDLSIVGYDDITLAQWSSPALTTIHQPLRRMAEEATTMMLTLSDGGELRQSRVDLAINLVVRGSTAPL